ncbi:MAG: S41 family peptidase [Dyadobacter sp.]
MKQKFSTLISCTLIILILSCKSFNEHENSINGIWECVGYGQQIEINDSLASFYDIYKTGRNLNFKISRGVFDNLFKEHEIYNDSLTIKFGITEYDFFRVGPNTKAESTDLTNSKDPLTNFDALWYTFEENYCSFDLRKVDWKKIREEYRNKINAHSTERELYLTLNEMVSRLNDGHVSIDMPESLEGEKAFAQDPVEIIRDSVIKCITEKYLKKTAQFNKGVINWGFINKDIAYIQINDFEKLANYGINPKLNTEQFFLEYSRRAEKSENYVNDVKQGARKQMEYIFKAIKLAKSCIIDIRFNGGGSDEAALEVVSHFVKSKTIAFHKKVKFGKEYSRDQRIIVSPAENYFDGKLFILTSPQTASAAETFVLASLNLPNAVRIGSSTEGIFSDILSKKLPNGWDYGLSNEIYTSNKGINYERTGISSDFRIEYDKDGQAFYKEILQGVESGDRALETALKLASKME